MMMGSDPLDLKRNAPVWCGGCGRAIGRDEEHDEDCSELIETARKEAVRRLEPAVPFKGLLILYGLFACVAVAGFVVWNRWF